MANIRERLDSSERLFAPVRMCSRPVSGPSSVGSSGGGTSLRLLFAFRSVWHAITSLARSAAPLARCAARIAVLLSLLDLDFSSTEARARLFTDGHFNLISEHPVVDAGRF